MIKECALKTGNLPVGGLPRNSMVKVTDHPNMTSVFINGYSPSINSKAVTEFYSNFRSLETYGKLVLMVAVCVWTRLNYSIV